MVEDKEKDESSCSKQVDAEATEFEPGKKHPFTTILTCSCLADEIIS